MPEVNNIFLHGGGDKAESRRDTFGRFVGAATAVNPSGKLALILAEEDQTAIQENWQAYSAIFTALGVPAGKLLPLFVSTAKPLAYEMLAAASPSGLFVCGGVTPFYHQSLCADLSWVAYLRETGIPYGGTSAGAAIAAQQAVLGGWQAVRQGQQREIIFVGASEGIDPLTVRPGIGLVPFAVEIHAGQMGTLTRLIHAVDLGLASEGWAIDENTMLEVNGSRLNVHGQGYCYHVWRKAGKAVKVTFYTAPDTIEA